MIIHQVDAGDGPRVYVESPGEYLTVAEARDVAANILAVATRAESDGEDG